MKIVIVWFDERRQEIARTPEIEPGDQSRLAIPLDAQYAQTIMIYPELDVALHDHINREHGANPHGDHTHPESG